MRRSTSFSPRRYLVAVLAVAAAFILRALLSQWLGSALPFAPFMVAVAVAGWYGGLGPGLLATFGSIPLVLYFFMTPLGSWALGPSSQGWSVIFFGLTGFTVSISLGAMHSVRRRLELERSRQHQTESSLRVSEERFRVLAENVPSFIWTADSEGRITYANERWLAYCGLTAEQNQGGPDVALHPDDYSRGVEQWTRSLEEGTPYEIEVRNRRHDGAYRWFVTRAVPLRDPAGRIACWFGVTTDIHDQRQRQDELRRADRRKDEFLAILAHELRNPLAPMRNALETLQLAGRDASVRERSVQIMERQLGQMVRLIDDLLDVSRINRGTLELKRAPVELADILAGALETSRPLIEAGGHDLTVQSPEGSVVLDVDATRMSQVFSNLLANAAKFTPRGGRIVVVVEARTDDVVVRVRDSGVGIPEEARAAVFDMFVQLEPSLERSQQGGLGIGLTIVKRIVEIHGGTVEITSCAPNQGSEFAVRLPRSESSVVPARPARDEVARPRAGERAPKILVVDDNADNVSSLQMMFELMEYQVVVAHHGLEALAVAERVRPDVILLDIGMPGINGYEVARAIRNRDWGKSPKLVAMTGWGQEADRRRSEEAGFDVHVVKPVEPDRLLKLVASSIATPVER